MKFHDVISEAAAARRLVIENLPTLREHGVMSPEFDYGTTNDIPQDPLPSDR